MRELATVQEVHMLKPIPEADFIELAIIKGWQCVAKKGDFQAGDLCVYFEVDSFLPIDDERFEFLRKNSYRNNEFMDDGSGTKGQGFRIRTISLRGEISQGLVMPIAQFPEIKNPVPGLDVTELLRVRKWEIPEYIGNMGVAIGNKPHGIPTTDETRLQSLTEYLEAFQGKPYYISTKLDGTSCSVYVKDGQVGVCGRNEEYKEDVETSGMWKWVTLSGLKDRLLASNLNIALQGEFCGAGIQGNRLKLKEHNLFIFDVVYLEDGGIKKAGLNEMLALCEELKLDAVPIEEEGESFNYTLEELLEKAKGKYGSGLDKEGIVVRTKEMASASFAATKADGTEGTVVRRLSFKVLNNDFLKKEKE